MIVIVCSTTAQEVPTGVIVDIKTFATLPTSGAQVTCAACGNVHVWHVKDAFLALTASDNPPPTDLPATGTE